MGVAICGEAFGKTKICKLALEIICQQDVCCFHISVDNGWLTTVMQVL